MSSIFISWILCLIFTMVLFSFFLVAIIRSQVVTEKMSIKDTRNDLVEVATSIEEEHEEEEAEIFLFKASIAPATPQILPLTLSTLIIQSTTPCSSHLQPHEEITPDSTLISTSATIQVQSASTSEIKMEAIQQGKLANFSQIKNITEEVSSITEKSQTLIDELPLDVDLNVDSNHNAPSSSSSLDAVSSQSAIVTDQNADTVSDNTEHNHNIKSEMMSFTEWKKNKLDLKQKEENVVDVTKFESIKNKPIIKKSNKIKKNYASLECGAKVVSANNEATNFNALLKEDKDTYMLNPCNVKAWFIVELCERIEVESIDFANFEMFSSTPEIFGIYISGRYPSREWQKVGTFKGEPVKHVQTFLFEEKFYAKYMKIEIEKYFGQEHYCPLSLLRVFGTTEVEQFDDDDSDEHNDDEMKDQKNDTVENSNIFTSAKNVVVGLVNTMAERFSGRNLANFTNETEQEIIVLLPDDVDESIDGISDSFNNLISSLNISLNPTLDICFFHSLFLKKCPTIDLKLDIEAFQKIFILQRNNVFPCVFTVGKREMFTPKYDKTVSPLAVPMLSDEIEETDQNYSQMNTINSKSELNNAVSFVESSFPDIENSKYVLQTSMTLISKKVDQLLETKSLQTILNEGPSSETLSKNTLDLESTSLLNSVYLTPSTTSQVLQLSPTSTIDIGSMQQLNIQGDGFEIIVSPSVSPTDKISISISRTSMSISSTKNTIIPSVSKDSAETKTVNSSTVAPNHGGGMAGSKESVIMKLNAKVKALQANLTLSMMYLEEMSERYRTAVEDVDKRHKNKNVAFNITISAQKDMIIYQSQLIGNLTANMELLTSQVNSLSESLNAHHKMSELHFTWIFIEIILLVVVLLYCFGKRYCCGKKDKRYETVYGAKELSSVVTREYTRKKRRLKESLEPT